MKNNSIQFRRVCHSTTYNSSCLTWTINSSSLPSQSWWFLIATRKERSDSWSRSCLDGRFLLTASQVCKVSAGIYFFFMCCCWLVDLCVCVIRDEHARLWQPDTGSTTRTDGTLPHEIARGERERRNAEVWVRLLRTKVKVVSYLRGYIVHASYRLRWEGQQRTNR